MPRLGAHLSAAGGSWRAVEAAAAAGCEALQLFLRPPTRWAAPAVADAEPARFRTAAAAAGLGGLCFAHAPYLLNPGECQTASCASAPWRCWSRSCGAPVRSAWPEWCCTPAPRAKATAARRRRVAARGSPRRSIGPGRARPGSCSRARRGQAANSGVGRPSWPAWSRRAAAAAWASAWTPPTSGAPATTCCTTVGIASLAELAEHWGVQAPHLLHGNDTSVELGSRRDRHAPPGDGRLGQRFFRRLLADGRCASLPIVLEIPPGAGQRPRAPGARPPQEVGEEGMTRPWR